VQLGWRDLLDCQLRRMLNCARGVVIVLGYSICLSLAVSLLSRFMPGDPDSAIATAFLLLFFGIPLLVFIDARRLGAARIQHCPYLDSFSAAQYAAFAFFFNIFMLPVYVSLRGRIKRNSVTPEYVPAV
jgi:hypothetical protein